MNLQMLCSKKYKEDLINLSDWHAYVNKDTDLEQYWENLKEVENENKDKKLNFYSASVKIDKETHLELIFVAKNVEKIIKKINKLKDMNKIPLNDSLLDDVSRISIEDLEAEIAKIKEVYGPKSILVFDAGYNNICVDVIPEYKNVANE